MIIRKANMGDAEQLAGLYLQFWEVHRENPLHEPDFEVNYENCLNDATDVIHDRKFRLYVAVEGSEVLGFIVFAIEKQNKLFKVKKYGHLIEIVVDRKHRGKGIGIEMQNIALNYFKKKGIHYASCTVEIDNELALATWQKSGFKQISIDLIKEVA
jgi:ribosomal protein S18 acetylase RimI-like enzyme